MVPSWWKKHPVVVSVLAFAACSLLGMALAPRAFEKVFGPPPTTRGDAYFWDAEHYLRIATSGYVDDKEVAFYPLWPMLIRLLTPGRDSEKAIPLLFWVSTLLFLASLPLLHRVFRRFTSDDAAALLVAAFALSPVSVFHVIGYAESLFSVLFVPFVWALSNRDASRQRMWDAVLVLASMALSLTRPVMAQMVSASLASLLVMRLLNPSVAREDVKRAVLVSVGAVLGYCVYGVLCVVELGDFLAPFKAQKYWHEEGIKLRISLLWDVGRETAWDAGGLYLPAAILFLAMGLVWRAHRKAPGPRSMVDAGVVELAASFPFWLCTFVAAAHSAWIFLSQHELGSLGRHVFAVPWIFAAAALLSRHLAPRLVLGLAGVWLVGSAVGLVQVWTWYGQDKFFG